MNYTSEQINEAYNKAPQHIKDLVNSPDLTQIIIKIVEKNNLLLDQASIISDNICLALLGLISGNDFYTKIKELTSLQDPVVNSVVRDIDTLIFSKLRNKNNAMVVEANKDIEPAHEILAHIEDPNKEVAQRVVTPFSVPITIPDPAPTVIATNTSKNTSTETSADTSNGEENLSNENPENLPEIEPEHRITIKVDGQNPAQNNSSQKETRVGSASNPYSIVDTKLSKTVSNPTKQYTVDPYREPPTP